MEIEKPYLGPGDRKNSVCWDWRKEEVGSSMKIKRFIAMTLVLCLVSSFAFAEENEGSVLDWLRNAWEDTKNWTENAWNDTTTWTGDAWNNVKGWWVDTFQTVTDKTNGALEWVGNESEAFKSTLKEKYTDIAAAAKDGIANAGESIKNVYEDLLKKLNLNEIDTAKILETLKVYADKIGVSVTTVAAALLPYLVKIVIESTVTGKSIPAVAVAMFLTAVIDKLDVTTEEQAEQLVDGFVKQLGI